MKSSLKHILTLALWGLSTALIGFGGYMAASDASGEDVAVITAREALLPGCSIELEYSYTLCSHEERISADPREYIGMDAEAFAAALPGCKVTDFTSTGASARRVIEQYCPDHLILKERDGGVSVLRTISGTDEQETLRHIALESIPEAEREKLAHGMVFQEESLLNIYVSRLKNGGR